MKADVGEELSVPFLDSVKRMGLMEPKYAVTAHCHITKAILASKKSFGMVTLDAFVNCPSLQIQKLGEVCLPAFQPFMEVIILGLS
jgi:hypothetical protein